MDGKCIELHYKKGKQLYKFVVSINFIVSVSERRSGGSSIHFLLHDGWGGLAYHSCIESCDEVMALIDNANK